MTENKTKEVIEGVFKQVGQTWTKVQPQLQALLLKLIKSLSNSKQSSPSLIWR
jgi:hypothetical protein